MFKNIFFLLFIENNCPNSSKHKISEFLLKKHFLLRKYFMLYYFYQNIVIELFISLKQNFWAINCSIIYILNKYIQKNIYRNQ